MWPYLHKNNVVVKRHFKALELFIRLNHIMRDQWLWNIWFHNPWCILINICPKYLGVFNLPHIMENFDINTKKCPTNLCILFFLQRNGYLDLQLHCLVLRLKPFTNRFSCYFSYFYCNTFFPSRLSTKLHNFAFTTIVNPPKDNQKLHICNSFRCFKLG